MRRHLAFIAWPVAWLGYTLIRAAVSHPGFPGPQGAPSRYPYDFLDAEVHGWRFVSLMIVVVTIALLALASAYVRLSGRFARASVRRARA